MGKKGKHVRWLSKTMVSNIPTRVKQVVKSEDFTENILDPSSSFEAPEPVDTSDKEFEGKTEEEKFQILLKRSVILVKPKRKKKKKELKKPVKRFKPNLRWLTGSGFKSTQKCNWKTVMQIPETNMEDKIPEEKLKQAESTSELNLNNPDLNSSLNQPADSVSSQTVVSETNQLRGSETNQPRGSNQGFNPNKNLPVSLNAAEVRKPTELLSTTGIRRFSNPKERKTNEHTIYLILNGNRRPWNLPQQGIPKSMVYAKAQEMQMQMMQHESQSLERTHTYDQPMFVDTSSNVHQNQVYSPTDIYEESAVDLSGDELISNTSNSDVSHAGQKRVSAFQRLGPQAQPKTPKITINLNLEHEKPVREVVDETDVYDDDKYSPVHLRPSLINSTDETVMKYLIHWPYKQSFNIKRTAGARSSKSAMLYELEKMEELYEKDNAYFLVEVRGYPASWNKENVLDAVLESLKERSFIPCFIDFTKRKCRFLVLKSKAALVDIHKNGFVVQKDDVELRLYISSIFLMVNHLDFIPRLILRKRVMMGYDGESKLDLKGFTLKEDISHFIYYPLHRGINQTEITELKTTLPWKFLTHLNLSYNRLTSISGFNLRTVTPELKHLDLSHNLLNRITGLLCCRDLPLNSINLEGNPLSLDYIDSEHYVKVIRMIFPTVKVIDGEKLHVPGKMPTFRKHYCPDGAKAVVDRFLEVFFPLLDSDEEQRINMESLYDTRAVMTVTYNPKLRCNPVYRCFQNMFMWARVLEDGKYDSLEGSLAIMKLVNKWPYIKHDPTTFNVDVLHHNDTTTIVRICGVFKLTAKSLADDEHLMAFTRTFVLKTENGSEYKIRHDMVYWDEPTKECVKEAFQRNTISTLQLTLKPDSEPDKDLKEKLLKIFMKITDMDKRASLRCLEEKNWHFKEALEYLAKLLKMDNLNTIMKP